MTSADLKAALVEALKQALTTSTSGDANVIAAQLLAALPPVLERFGCKVVSRDSTDAMEEAGEELDDWGVPSDPGTGNASAIAHWEAMWNAAPLVAWEE
jgi:hypothetical protein